MIDLKKIISNNPKTLTNVQLLESDLLRAYPNNRREIRILTSFMQCGIVRELKNKKNGPVTDWDRSRYLARVYNDYGFDEKYTKPLLELWIGIFSPQL